MSDLELYCVPIGFPMPDFSITVKETATVSFLKGAVLGTAELDGGLASLELYLAKEGGKSDGNWLTTKHPDYALLKRGDEATIARYLNDGTLIDRVLALSHNFTPPLPGGRVHILVKITASEEPPLKRPRTMASIVSSFWDNYTLEPMQHVNDAEFDLDNLDKAVGTTVSTPGLHAFWKELGEFPESFIVRKEDHEVWSVVKQTLLESSDKVVLMGSPGVGKSTLVALAVAFVLQKKVLVVRKMKTSCLEGFVVYLTPDGLAYCAENVESLALCDFVLRQPTETYVFVDGFTQDEVNAANIQAFSLMATSCHYDKKSDDPARRVSLPAWRFDDLLRYAKATDWVTKVGLLEKKPLDEDEETWRMLVEQHYFYSGGSLGEFCRAEDEIKGEVRRACALLQQDKAFKLACYPFADYGATQPDRLRRHYVVGERNAQCYINYSKWRSLVDSGYALRLLSSRVDVPSHVELYTTAKSIGGGLERVAFEQLVHRAMRSHVTKPWKWDLRQPAAPAFRLETCVTEARCAGETEDGCMDEIKQLRWGTYWHPKGSAFPFIDAIMPCKMYNTGVSTDEGEDVVVYVLVNIQGEKAWSPRSFAILEDTVAGNAHLRGKKRVFLLVTECARAAEAFKMKQLPPSDECLVLVSYVDPTTLEQPSRGRW